MKKQPHAPRVRIALPLFAMLTLAALVGAVAEAPIERGREPPFEQLQANGVAAAPRWAAGDWWRLEVRDLVRQTQQEYTVIVAAVNETGYRVGASQESDLPLLLLFHVPFVGEVATDLGWVVHEQVSQLVRFPLRAGDQWDTHVEGENVRAIVDRATTEVADLIYVRPDGSRLGTATYDARLATLSRYDYTGFMESVVVERGSAFAQRVHAPMNVTSLIGSFWNLESVQYDATGTSSQVVTIEASRDAVGFMLFLRGQADGLYRSRVVLPDGASYESSVTPLEGPNALAVHRAGNPRGDWTLEQQVIGAGSSWIEAIGYDIDAQDPILETCASDCAARASKEIPPSPQGATPWLPVALVFAGFTFVVWAWPRIRPVAVVLFARLTRGKALDQRTRRVIHQLLEADPGLTTQEIRKRLGIGWGTAVHHLDVLRQLGFVDVVQWGRDRDHYPRGWGGPAQRAWASAMRRPATAAVLQAIRDAPSRSQLALARQLGLHHGTIAYHGKRLAELGLVRIEVQRGRVAYIPLL